MKFSKRYIITPILLVGFIYLLMAEYEEVKNKTFEEFHLEQTNIAKQASIGIENFFSQYNKELTFLASLPDVANFNERGKEILNNFCENRIDQIEAITRTNSKGKILYTFPINESAIGKDISYQSHVRTIINSHHPVVSDVFLAVQGYMTIAFHVPIFREGKFVGTLAILIKLNKLSGQYLEGIQIGETGYARMLSEKNIELYHPDLSHVGKPILESAIDSNSILSLIDKIKSQENGNIVYYDHSLDKNNKNIVKTLAVFQRIPLFHTYWTVIITIPEEEVYQTLAGYQARLSLIFAVVFIVISIYFYSIAKAKTTLKEEKKRRLTEKALFESEERYKGLVDYSTSSVIVLKDNRIVFANPVTAKILGYISENDLLNKNILEIIHPSDIESAKESLSRLYDGRTKEPKELRVLMKTGKFRVIISTAIQINYEAESAIMLISHDITERKMAESERERLLTILESSLNEIYIFDSNTFKFQYINEGAIKNLGYTIEEMKELTPIGIKPEFTKEYFSKSVEPLFEGKTDKIVFQTIHKRKDGSTYPVEVNLQLVGFGSEKVFLAIVLDITHRTKAEKALRESEEKNRALSEATIEALFFSNKGRLIECNRTATEMFGYTRDEIIGMPGHNLVPTEYRERVKNNILSGFDKPYEVIAQRKDGSKFYVQFHGRMYKYKGQNVRVTTAIDISEQKKNENIIKESEEKYKALAAQLINIREEERVHIARELHDELGQGLTGIKMDVTWLKTKIDNDKSFIDNEEFNFKTDAIISLIDDNIKFVRKISTELRPNLLDYLGLVAALEWQLNEFVERTGIKVEFITGEPNYNLNPQQEINIYRICQEVLTNVTRHAKASNVVIHLWIENGYLNMNFTDDGESITPEKINNKKSFGILGMRERASILNGNIEFEGLAEGGTRVSLKIPLEVDS